MTNPRANKELGQHYLKDQKAIQMICHDFSDQAEIIIEVGPGPTSLTKTLATLDRPLFVIEKDKRFEEQLNSCVKPENIFFEDALKFNWEHFLQSHSLIDKKIWLVSNLPYNISVPLLMSFMKVPAIQYMTLMFQKEVGDKTFLRPDSKNQMGSLVALCENYFKTRSLLKVAPGAFHPPPKVNSIVISYERKKDPEIPLASFSHFEAFLRALFQFKRKQMGKVLKGLHTPEEIQEMLIAADAKAQDRAESLNFAQIIALYKFHCNLSS